MSNNNQNSNEYSATSIKVLKGLQGVKQRPGMYIGNVYEDSGHCQMLFEVLDNAVDEFLAGHATEINVVLHKDDSATITDNGRGIPTETHEEGQSAAVVIMTQLHAGGKFDDSSYKVSGGLHGVGVSVVNALSEFLKLTIYRDSKKHYAEFKDGNLVHDLKVLDEGLNQTGTEVTFFPSKSVFTSTKFNRSIIKSRVKDLSFLNKGLKIIYKDEESNEEIEFFNEGGVLDFIKEISSSQSKIHDPVYINKKYDEIDVEISFVFTEASYESFFAFTNNIKQQDGGEHISGFRYGLTKCITSYYESSNIKKEVSEITADDIREGLFYIVSIKMHDPKFASQTKDKLISKEVRKVADRVCQEFLSEWLDVNPSVAKSVCARIVKSAKAREAARRARDFVKRKNSLESMSLPGKLSDCQSSDPSESEIFIVEGDSAGGTAKQGRDRRTQAVLPLRGKILNVEKVSMAKVLNSEQITTLISALGTGIGELFDASKIRYHKIIIMTDADVDGSHIRTLILTFLYRHMRDVINLGYVYIAQPPLYKVSSGGKDVYIKKEKEMTSYLVDRFVNSNVISIKSEGQIAGMDLREVLISCIDLNYTIESYHVSMPKHVFEIFVIMFSGFSNFNNVQEFESILNECKNICNRYELEHDNPEWEISYENEVSNSEDVSNSKMLIKLKRLVRGVLETYSFDTKELSIISSLPCMNGNILTILRNMITQKNSIMDSSRASDNIAYFTTPLELYNSFVSKAKKNIQIQRYKGLGEMNFSQLSETTLDKDSRTILQVRIKDAEDASKMLETLMGGEVEERRNFILENADNVGNIDV